MKKPVALAALALVGIGLYHYRRLLLARFLKLPPPRYAVAVERKIPVPMPDGVRLFADHYFPKFSGRDGIAFPTILIRTPYGRGKEVSLGNGYPLAELPAQRFAERGYHVVVQGARGCFDSEGSFRPHVNEAADGEATVAWISCQPWFNGMLGTWGPSYLGYTQWATAASSPGALKAMLVMVASAENHSVTHPDGAFGLETRLRWSQGVHSQNLLNRRPLWEKLVHRFSGKEERRLDAAFDHLPLLEADTVAAGEALPSYRDLLTHPEPDDAFWAARDHRQAVAGIGAPVHLVGGWYDYYLRGLLRDYATLKSAGQRPYLTVGPWFHAHPAGMMTGLREGLAWFDAQLKGEVGGLRKRPVRLFVMGAEEWRELDAYPPSCRPTRYYLQPEGKLTTDPPEAAFAPDRYRYDPADPTPAPGGALLALRGAGSLDNRPLEARADVLCYTTPPLTCELEIIGPVRLDLFAQSSLPHTDFFGRLCDVAPDGCSTNVCDGLFRVEPEQGEGQPDRSSAVCLRIEIDMWATAYRFRRGHRLRLQVSSGSHPRWSRNLGTSEGLAEGMRMIAAEQIIYHDGTRPSALVLPVVSEG